MPPTISKLSHPQENGRIRAPDRACGNSADGDPYPLRPSELGRIERLIGLARQHTNLLSDKQRFALGLIGARVRRSGLASPVSDYERHLLNEVESRLFDLDSGDPPELDL